MRTLSRVASGALISAAVVFGGCGSGGEPLPGNDSATSSSASATTGGGGGSGGAGAGGSSSSSGGTAGEGTGGSVEPACNPTTGLSAPLRACTLDDPCTNLAAELGDEPITSPEVVPTCKATEPGAPPFDDGAPEVWTDPTGVQRHACRFSPAGAGPTSPRPLLVWLHGGGGGLASNVYDFTTIRQKAETWDLTGDPLRPGFHLVSVQGRSLHYPTGQPRDGHHHDFYYRDLAAPSTNPDIANVDRIVDELVASGAVDPARIYMMGWSNGGFFSQMYAVARHVTPTPGGNRIAAAAVFTAADPFNNTSPTQSPSCQLDPYPTSTVPIHVFSRACDIVACDEAQSQSFAGLGYETEPGHVVATWMEDLARKVGNPNASWTIVSGVGTAVPACTPVPPCSIGGGTLNHVRWPNGVADGSGIDHEPSMLDFLRDHPLP